jgi:energy-coupling factor transporter ATP-binding protein EcfA2
MEKCPTLVTKEVMTNRKMRSGEFFVTRIRAERLFGRFDYDLDLTCGSHPYPNRLALLYGDNGSGKTTLLRLLFHLLSPVDNRGHKSFVTKTKFMRFEVGLANGTAVIAERTQQKLTGNVELRIEHGSKVVAKLPLKVSEDGSVKMAGTADEPTVKRFLKRLAQLNVEILFMRDTRRLSSSLDPTEMAEESENRDHGAFVFEMTRENTVSGMSPRREAPLVQAVGNVTKFFREQALAASTKGEVDTNKIYDEIIKHLVMAERRPPHYSEAQYRQYMQRLAALTDRNQAFVEVGLASPLLATHMIRNLNKAQPGVRPALMNVLQPFIDSVQARLDALEGIRRTIFQFTDSLNSFIGQGKRVVFDLGSGLNILGYDGEPLNPEALSSGERQLLAMFCHIVAIKDRTAIFMIDEPELSLNVKWQRRIVQSLLGSAEGTSVQFIMASHSLEVLAPHRGHVVQLVNNAAK